MTSAILERPIAILYDGHTATWCKGGCGRFRYPYCYVDARPFCHDCASLARIQAVAAPSLSSKPKIVAAKPKTNRANTSDGMLAILKAGPASSKDLATQLGVHQVTITDWAKRLASKGKIIRRRESGIYPSHPFLYALPEHEALLEEKLGKPITDLIKKQLSEPKTASELFELIPKYTPRAISDNLRQLAQEGKLIFRIKKGKRVYALPQQEQRLEEITIVSIDISILSLLKENPRLWIREIARRLEISTATATKYLEQLVEEGKLTRTKFGCVFYELAGDA